MQTDGRKRPLGYCPVRIDIQRVELPAGPAFTSTQSSDTLSNTSGTVMHAGWMPGIGGYHYSISAVDGIRLHGAPAGDDPQFASPRFEPSAHSGHDAHRRECRAGGWR